MKIKVGIGFLILALILGGFYYRYSISRSSAEAAFTPLDYAYEISKDSNVENVYLITKDKEKFNFEKYTVKKDGMIEISVPQNKEFIISLYANKTVDAKWNVEKKSDNISLQRVDWIELNKTKDSKATGKSPARQYFYFKAKTESSENLEFLYKHNKENQQYFRFSMKVKGVSSK